jgi:hypothetical protein
LIYSAKEPFWLPAAHVLVDSNVTSSTFSDSPSRALTVSVDPDVDVSDDMDVDAVIGDSLANPDAEFVLLMPLLAHSIDQC